MISAQGPLTWSLGPSVKTFAFVVAALTLTGCAQRAYVPLSACAEPMDFAQMTYRQLAAVLEARELSVRECAGHDNGCSIVLQRQYGQEIVVVVAPVVGIANGECTYASDTQTYFHFDSAGNLISANRGI